MTDDNADGASPKKHVRAPSSGDHGSDPGLVGAERQRLERELEATLRRLTTDLSDLAMTKLLPKAKALYEQLHPETRHGGARSKLKKQDAKFATRSFAQHVADTRGISRRTVHNRLTDAEKLASLDADAEIGCYGTALANQIKILIRIAAIPDPALQRDLVVLFDRVRIQAKADLARYEQNFGLCSPPAPPNDKEDEESDRGKPEGPNDATAAARDGEQDAGKIEDGAPEQESETHAALTGIMEALGVTTVNDCLLAIQQLKAKQAGGEDLRAQLRRAEATNAKLTRELATYENAPLGQLFCLLGAKTANDALAKARALLELTNAA